MHITEKQLRKVICEELIRLNEQGSIIPYSSEKSAQGMSTAGKLAYGAARGVLGATPTGARATATGRANIIPTAGEAVSNAWNSTITDWTLTSLAAIADFMGGPGVVVSIAIAKVQLLKAIAANDWFSAAMAVISSYPAAGDAIGIIGRLIKSRAPVTNVAIQTALKAVGSITDGALQTSLYGITQMITDPATVKKINDNTLQIIAAKNKFVADLKKSIA